MLPQEPCPECKWPIYSNHQPGCTVKVKIDNAKERGNEVDALFSGYVNGTLDRIPAGTREDSKLLFFKLQRWFDGQRFSEARAQELVADDEVGGRLDLRLDGMITDLKATFEVNPAAAVQVGGYVSLSVYQNRTWPDKAAILHVTERYATPKLHYLDPQDVANDFEDLRKAYRVAVRRSKWEVNG